MTNQSQGSQFEALPESDASPIYVHDENLYVSATEWERLCSEQSTSPLLNVLGHVRGYLSRGKAVRLIGADGGISLSADRPSEFQFILDDANRRRANSGLAPAIPLN